MGVALGCEFNRSADNHLVQVSGSPRTLLTSSSNRKVNRDVKAEANAGGTFSCELHVDTAFEAVREKAKWNVHPWAVERAEPKIGDLRTFDSEVPGFGHMKTVAKCLKYEATDAYYMYEYCVQRSDCMPVGYKGCLQIKKGTSAVSIEYKATWADGKVSAVTQDWLKASLIDHAGPQAPWFLAISSWDFNSRSGVFFCGLQSDKSLDAVREKAKWGAHPYDVERSVPEIGDVRVCREVVSGLGHVKTVERCLEYESTDAFYMHKYCVDESNLMPAGYKGSLYVTAEPTHSLIEYEGVWTAGVFSSRMQDLIKAKLYSMAK